MSPTASSHGGVDPAAPGTIVRNAIAFEAIFTAASGAYLIFFPRHFLVRSMGAAATQVTTTAIQQAQQYGSCMVLVGGLAAVFIPNTRTVFEARPMLYRALGAFEVFLYIPLMVYQAYMQEGGLPKGSSLASAAMISGFAAWRAVTLFWKCDWFGRWKEGRKVE
jgi:hypothetical protein